MVGNPLPGTRGAVRLLLLVVLVTTACGGTQSTPPTSPPPTQAPATPTLEAASPPATVGSGVKVAASGVERVTDPDVSTADLETWASGHNDFALRLYQAIREDGDNLFFSPYSISTALAMTYAGARGNTATQMEDVLGFTLPQETLHPVLNAVAQSLMAQQTLTLTVANSLWVQEGYAFQDAFLNTLARNYGAGLFLVDYIDPQAREEARLAINAWVEAETQDRIQDLITENMLTDLTRLVLANAIYFKGEWEDPFLSGTTEDTFVLLDGSEVRVPMMSRRASTPYVQAGSYEVVALPYTGGRMQMVLLIPASGEFAEVESRLDADFAQDVIDQLTRSDVKLYMPRFSYDARLELEETLKAMGMPDAFDPDRADFSGMDGTTLLSLSRVAHKAFVAVDEEGTEAAAATGVVAEIESLPAEVRVDRPFIFFIHDTELNLLLFVGRVLNPAPSE